MVNIPHFGIVMVGFIRVPISLICLVIFIVHGGVIIIIIPTLLAVFWKLFWLFLLLLLWMLFMGLGLVSALDRVGG